MSISNKLERFLPKSGFARSVSVLVSGTAAGQVILVLIAPILTRLYAPEDFGLLAFFAALAALVGVVASLRYQLAIPLPESDRDGAHILALCLCAVVGTTLITILLVLLFGEVTAAALGEPSLTRYLWLLPVAVVLTGTYQALEKWAVRKRAFGDIAQSKIIQSGAAAGTQLGLFVLGPLGLILGQVIGHGAGSGRLASLVRRNKPLHCVTLGGMTAVAIRYSRFPIYSTWNGLLNTASLQMVPVVLVALFGAATAGLYALTLRILTLPANLIGNAVGSVFLSRAPSAHREGKLTDLVENIHQRLAFVGVPAMVLLLFAGPELFGWVFGDQWTKAGVYAQWMAPWIYLQFQWSPLSTLASVLELQRAALVSQALTFSTRLGVLLACAWLATSADVAVLAFAIASALTYLVRALWFLGQAGVSPMHVLRRECLVILSFLLLTSPTLALLQLDLLAAWVAALAWFALVTVLWLVKAYRASASTQVAVG